VMLLREAAPLLYTWFCNDHLSQTCHSWGCHNQAADKYIILLLMQLSRLLTDHGYNHLSFAVPGLVLSFINYNW